MYYEVFIDVIFIENLIADFIAIHLSQQALYQRNGFARSLQGAFLGACVAVVRLLLPVRTSLLLFVIYGLGCCATVLIAFRKIRQMFVQICSVHFFMLLFGALLFMVKRLLRWHQKELAVYGFMGIAVAFDVTGNLLIRYFQRWIRKKNKKLFHVWIYFDKDPICVMALLDTGNQLRDPVSGEPVSILEQESCMLKGDIKVAKNAYCCIPFHTIGKDYGVLHGIHVPLMKVQMEGKIIEHKNAVVAIYQGKLSNNNAFQMILQPDLLQI